MLLDRYRLIGQLDRLLVSDAEAVAAFFIDFTCFYTTARLVAVNHLDGLGPAVTP